MAQKTHKEMSDHTKLQIGEIITTPQKREAIHVAVYPMVAEEQLFPGQRIGIIDDRATTRTETIIGVVDPFLRTSVGPGQRFWLFLYPGTVKDLRHEWSHPVLDDLSRVAGVWAAEQKSKDDEIKNLLEDRLRLQERIRELEAENADYDDGCSGC